MNEGCFAWHFHHKVPKQKIQPYVDSNLRDCDICRSGKPRRIFNL